jgi:Dolichyl-phosphate-mannose-protein mannosyltransferase
MGDIRLLQAASYYVLPALPLIAFAGFFALFLGRLREREQEADDWRHAFLLSVAIWSVLTFAFTELLSLGSALSFLYLGLCWGIVVLVLVFILRRTPVLRLRDHVWSTAKKLPVGEKALLLWIALSLAITLSIALAAPPNNDDALTYHMSRVAHWWVNQTVAFYPTNIQRQLYLSPFAEYVILQFFVLSGGSDRLANLVQWFGFGGCAIAMSLIARRLGADRFVQTLVAFVVLTTPLFILQATSTHNDLTCAFLAATTLYFLYREKTVLTGICLGLAILVKLTAGLAIAPFLLLPFLREPLHRRGILKAVGKLAAIGAIALALNAPQWLRNLHIFDNPLSSETMLKRNNSQTLAFGPFVTTAMRDLTVELETTSPRVNQMEEDAVREICKILRLDPDDPRNTAVPYPAHHFSVPQMTPNEDYAPNPLQTVLLIAATIFLLASRRFRRSEFAKFAVFVWAGYLLIAWLLSWQPAVTRYLAPFIALSSLPTALFLGEIRRRSRLIAWAIIVVLAMLSLEPMRHNVDRPLVTFRPPRSVFTTPRAEQYFVRRPEERSCYVKTVEILSAGSCGVVGLKLSEAQWEYPLWALARSGGSAMIFEHIDVDNPTRNARAGFQGMTCATVTIHDGYSVEPTSTQPAWIELHRLGPDGADIANRIDCEP